MEGRRLAGGGKKVQDLDLLSAMQMPKIYGQHGRLVRAARIARNQIVRGGEYLHRRAHVSGIDRLTPDWQLVPPYNPAVEGA